MVKNLQQAKVVYRKGGDTKACFGLLRQKSTGGHSKDYRIRHQQALHRQGQLEDGEPIR